MGWNAVTASNPCPICGASGVGAEVKCATSGQETWCASDLDLNQAPVGWVYRNKVGTGFHYVQAGRVEQLSGRSVEEIQRKAGEATKAKNLWKRCRHFVEGTPAGCPEGMGANHARIRAYVEARGVPLDRLPGGCVPASARYYGKCPRMKDRLPAIVCAFSDHGGRVIGVQRIFLEPGGEPRKISDGRDKMQLGDFGADFGGGAVRITPKDDVNGVLVLTEGVETGWAVAAALSETNACVWATLSTSGLKNFRLHPKDALVAVGGWVKRVIIAGDHDHVLVSKAEAGPRRRPGADAARRCAEQLKADWPEIDVSVAMPNHAVVPEFVREDGWVLLGESKAEDTTPIEGKSCDWLDVLRAIGPDRTAEAIYQPLELQQGVDLDGARKSAGKAPKLLPTTDIERALLVLQNLWAPAEPNGAYRIRRLQKSWRVRDEDGLSVWRDVDDEFVEQKVRHFLDPYLTIKNGKWEPCQLSGSALSQVVKAMIPFVGVVDAEMPQWLPPNVDAAGNPLPQTVLRFTGKAKAGPIPTDAVVCARNGLLDVEAWCGDESRVVVHAPTTRWFNSNCLPYDINAELLRQIDPDDDKSVWKVIGSRAPVFCKFVGELTQRDRQRHDALQYYAGYLLTAFNVYRKMLWIQGPPKGGKSLWGKLMCQLVGEGNFAPATWDQVESKFNAALVGPNLIIMDDLRIPRKSDTAAGLSRFLTMSTGGVVQKEDKHIRATRSARTPGKFIICTNDDPEVPDNSGAFVDRLLFVRTGGRPKKVDPFLLEKLVAEMEYILVWALDGLRKLRRAGGFVQPEVDADALGDIRRSLQPVAAYVEDECVVDGEQWAAKDSGKDGEVQVLRRWCTPRLKFCEEFNKWMTVLSPSHKPWSEKSIWKQLQSAGFTLERAQRQHLNEEQDVYVGLRPRLRGEKVGQKWVHPENATDAQIAAQGEAGIDYRELEPYFFTEARPV